MQPEDTRRTENDGDGYEIQYGVPCEQIHHPALAAMLPRLEHRHGDEDELHERSGDDIERDTRLSWRVSLCADEDVCGQLVCYYSSKQIDELAMIKVGEDNRITDDVVECGAAQEVPDEQLGYKQDHQEEPDKFLGAVHNIKS